jgi:hypothetical protein
MRPYLRKKPFTKKAQSVGLAFNPSTSKEEKIKENYGPTQSYIFVLLLSYYLI